LAKSQLKQVKSR